MENYDYDIFISFAQTEKSRVDIEWSLKFCNLLDNLLNKMTNEQPVIITSADVDGRVNMFNISKNDIYTKSSVFVVILSEESLHDEEFIEEIKDIYNNIEMYNQGDINKSFRVFTILSSPIAYETLPDCLKHETSYNFFETNIINGKTQIFDLSYSTKKDNIYWSRLVDLAYDCGTVIKQLKTEGKVSTFEDKNTVYLATCSLDQEENRDILKRDLKQSGFNVIPDFNLPSNGGNFKDMVEGLISKSEYSLHILGGYYGSYLNELPYSATEYQIKITSNYLNTDSNLERIIWISSDLNNYEQKQRLFIGRIKRDETINNSEIIECPLEDVKSIINSILRPEKPEVKVEVEKSIFFQHPEMDDDEIKPILDILNSTNAEVTSTKMLNQDTILQKYWDQLLIADILLFYYNGNKFWLDFKIKDVLKVRGYQKGEKSLKVLVISDSENTPSFNFIDNYTVINKTEIDSQLLQHLS